MNEELSTESPVSPQTYTEFKQETEADKHESKPRNLRFVLIIVGSLLAGITLIIGVNLSRPSGDAFPTEFTVTPGATVADIAALAAESGVVRSEQLLYIVLRAFYDPTNIHAGTYTFLEPASLFITAERLASSDTELILERVTFPEGLSLHTLAEIAATSASSIAVADYLKAAEGKEGYLFPDTYLIPPSMTADELVALQQQTLEEKLEPFQATLSEQSRSLREVIILASIVEREANTPESMQLVAGILLNRLAIGMPLQADATIEYVLDTPLNELPPGQLAEELRTIDSPYNTYRNPGLPPTPIGNPGMTAIEAVINPTASSYLYYITGNDGVFYYAQTLQEHNQNIADHLR